MTTSIAAPSHSSASSPSISRLRRICVTPTRNESWIIRPFARAVLSWADHLIVADQHSTDDTLKLLQDLPGVTPVINDSPKFDENYRQKLLLSHARKIAGQRLLVGLDADEALSANALLSRDWDRIAAAQPGTIVRFRWVNILPGFKEAWIPPNLIPCGFIDDGTEHVGKAIHSARVPNPEGAPYLDLDDIVVLHLQYVAWDRMESKQRWYQAWEHTSHKAKGPLQIFREYNHMRGSWKRDEIFPLKPEWFSGYEHLGIDFRSLKSEPVTWWDREVVRMLRELGPAHFRRIAIWEKDWNSVCAEDNLSQMDLSDPRSSWEKTAHRLLKLSQANRGAMTSRALEFVLRRTGW
jgi:hypothetical protein